MAITVRPARLDDIDWIISQLKIFSSLYGSKKSLYGDEAYCREGLKLTIEKHLFLMAVLGDTPLGFIAGFVGAHPYNPSITLLTEFFWWVAEEHRGSRAGIMLLDEYVRWGKEHADWVTFGITNDTLIRESNLLRRGFKPNERSYLLENMNKLEVSPCQPPPQS